MSAPEATDGAEEVAADPAEPVDTYANSHCGGSCFVQSAGCRGDGSDPIARPVATRHGRVRRTCRVTTTRGRQPSSASISGVSDASVSGMPSSSARLSAIASSRRIRPAIASLVSTGSCSWPSSSSEACLCSSRSCAGQLEVVGDLVAEDLHRPLDAGAGGHGGAGGAAQVGVVEVGEPVGGGPHLAAHPALLPGHQRLVGAEPGQQLADRVAVADHDPVDAADLAGLGLDAEPAGDADERERRLRAGAGDLERRRAAGLGQRAVREERAAPRGDGVAAATGHHGGRQAAHRPAALVEQAGLAGQRLAVLDHPHDVAAALADAVALHHHDVGLVAVDLGDVRAQPTGGGAGVELGLDHDPAAHDVQSAGEPQHRGDLGLATARLGDLGARQLRLHLCRHRHAADPATRVNDPRSQDRSQTPHDAGVRRGQLRRVVPGVPSRSATSATTQLARRSDATAACELVERVADAVARRRAPCAIAQVGRVLGEHREVVRRRRSPAVSPACSAEVEHDDHAGRRSAPAPRAAAGTIRCGITEVNHEPGPSTTQSASRDRGERLGARRRVGRVERDRDDLARRWSRPRPGRAPSVSASGSPGRGRAPAAVMSIGVSAIGSTRPGRRAAGRPSRAPSTWSPSSSHRPTISRLPIDVAAHLAVAGEPVLQHPRPGVAPLVVAAQRGQRHPQVAGRQHAELAAQPPRRAAVVGDGDDGGQVVDDQVGDEQAQRLQGGGQAVAAAEGDDGLGAVVRPSRRSLPPQVAVGRRVRRSPAARSRRAISSVIATLRCLPPVQPIATVMNRLPSRR